METDKEKLRKEWMKFLHDKSHSDFGDLATINNSFEWFYSEYKVLKNNLELAQLHLDTKQKEIDSLQKEVGEWKTVVKVNNENAQSEIHRLGDLLKKADAVIMESDIPEMDDPTNYKKALYEYQSLKSQSLLPQEQEKPAEVTAEEVLRALVLKKQKAGPISFATAVEAMEEYLRLRNGK